MSILIIELLILFVLIMLNGVLAMAEIALVSARKSRLEQQAARGKHSAKIALKLAKAPNRFLATVQIGITLVGILAGVFGGATLAEVIAKGLAQIPLLAAYSQALSLILVVILITYLTLVFGELVPKRLAMNNPEVIAVRIAPGMDLLSRITAPLNRLLSVSTDFVLRLVRGYSPQEPPVTEEDIKALVRQGTQTGVVAEVEQQMVTGIFRLGDRRADALMTPRPDIEWLDLNVPIQDLIQTVQSSPHSVFPAARGDLEHVVGILPIRELLKRTTCEPDERLHERDLQQPFWVPESTPALRLLKLFQQDGHKMALVFDEYGGLSGLITPQDILDSIYGDDFQLVPKRGKESKQEPWLLTGLTPVDQLVEFLPIQDLPETAGKDYKTLGGMITTHLGRIPNPGDKFTYQGLSFEVLTMDQRRIDKVRVTKSQGVLLSNSV